MKASIHDVRALLDVPERPYVAMTDDDTDDTEYIPRSSIAGWLANMNAGHDVLWFEFRIRQIDNFKLVCHYFDLLTNTPKDTEGYPIFNFNFFKLKQFNFKGIINTVYIPLGLMEEYIKDGLREQDDFVDLKVTTLQDAIKEHRQWMSHSLVSDRAPLSDVMQKEFQDMLLSLLRAIDVRTNEIGKFLAERDLVEYQTLMDEYSKYPGTPISRMAMWTDTTTENPARTPWLVEEELDVIERIVKRELYMNIPKKFWNVEQTSNDPMIIQIPVELFKEASKDFKTTLALTMTILRAHSTADSLKRFGVDYANMIVEGDLMTIVYNNFLNDMEPPLTIKESSHTGKGGQLISQFLSYYIEGDGRKHHTIVDEFEDSLQFLCFISAFKIVFPGPATYSIEHMTNTFNSHKENALEELKTLHELLSKRRRLLAAMKNGMGMVEVNNLQEEYEYMRNLSESYPNVNIVQHNNQLVIQKKELKCVQTTPNPMWVDTFSHEFLAEVSQTERTAKEAAMAILEAHSTQRSLELYGVDYGNMEVEGSLLDDTLSLKEFSKTGEPVEYHWTGQSVGYSVTNYIVHLLDTNHDIFQVSWCTGPSLEWLGHADTFGGIFPFSSRTGKSKFDPGKAYNGLQWLIKFLSRRRRLLAAFAAGVDLPFLSDKLDPHTYNTIKQQYDEISTTYEIQLDDDEIQQIQERIRELEIVDRPTKNLFNRIRSIRL